MAMFLNLLTPPQQRVFLQAARAVAEQDGTVAEVEHALLSALRTETGLLDEPDAATESMEDVLDGASDMFDTSISKRVFMLELAGVVAIDGEAHPAELDALRSAGHRLGIEEDDLAEFVEFGMEARALAARGRELIASAAGTN
jgi:uncharacterized tellurite resistance protein B-like protein